MEVSSGSPIRTSTSQTIFRLLLGAMLFFAGLGHLTWARTEFQAQVPDWVPMAKDLVVLLSGIVEIVLGASLILLGKYRVLVGWMAAFFFIAVFPGNISQFINRTDAFGLNSDTARAVRLLFQPILVAWALWSTGAWIAWRKNH